MIWPLSKSKAQAKAEQIGEALASGDVKKFKKLLGSGFGKGEQDLSVLNAFEAALAAGSEECARAVAEAFDLGSAEPFQGRTAGMIAAAFGSELKDRYWRQEDLARIDDGGRNVFMYACILGKGQAAHGLSGNFDPMAPDEEGNTFLHHAAGCGSFEGWGWVEIFPLEELCAKRNMDGERPLERAVKSGNADWIRFLLRRSKAKEPDALGNTALHYAVNAGLKAISAVAPQSDIMAKNFDGKTAEDLAQAQGLSQEKAFLENLRKARAQ